MSKKRKKQLFVLKVDDFFQDREHARVDIKNLTVREFTAIAYALRWYVQRFGVEGQEDELGIRINNLSRIFDDAKNDIEATLFDIY